MPRRRQAAPTVPVAPLAPQRRELREYLATTPETTVDRTSHPTHCIIKGVKLLSRSSPNTHGVEGVDGTIYTAEACESARSVYEGAKVNVDHLPRESNETRSAYDRAGMILNVRTKEGESWGDLFLLRSHSITANVCDAAESKTLAACFAMSHDALGEGKVEGNKFVVSKICECESIDIVADGGANRSLIESRQKRSPMPEPTPATPPAVTPPATPPARKTKTLKLLIEGLKSKKRRKAYLPLLEWDDGAYGGSEVMEGPAPEEEGDWKDDLVTAIGKLVQDDSPESHELAQKIMQMLKPASPDDDDEEELEEGDEDDEDDDKKSMPESRKLKRKMAHLERKDHCRDLMEQMEYVPPSDKRAAILDSLVGLKTDEARRTLIESLKGSQTPAKAGSKPPGSVRVETKEGKDTLAKPEDRMALLN